MRESQAIVALRIVRHGVLEVTWSDGYVGIVDLLGLIERGGVYSTLGDPATFARAAIAGDQNSICWVNCDGDRIDVGSPSLRVRAGVRPRFDAAA